MDTTGIVSLTVMTAALGWFAWRTGGLLFLKLEGGTAYPEVLTRAVVDLVGDAQKAIMIRDEGGPGSIYDDDRIVGAVRAKLETESELKVRAVFRQPVATKLAIAFADHPRVTVKTPPGTFPTSFVIINGGEKGVIATRDHAERLGHYRRYDCTHPFVTEHIRQESLVRHLQAMTGLS